MKAVSETVIMAQSVQSVSVLAVRYQIIGVSFMIRRITTLSIIITSSSSHHHHHYHHSYHYPYIPIIATIIIIIITVIRIEIGQG